MTLDAAQGQGNAELMVTVSENPTFESRQASVVLVSSTGMEAVVSVRQGAAPTPNPSYLEVTPNLFSFSKEGGSQELSISCDSEWKIDLSSDIEPVMQDNMNNIIDTVNDLNSNININELKKQAKKQYIIKYNIIQKLNDQNQNNPMSERSSMDGSVDEIITRKLIEIHRKNKKYEERIKKAYNQVKTSKTFNEQKGTFLNNMKVDCSDSIHNIEESDY